MLYLKRTEEQDSSSDIVLNILLFLICPALAIFAIVVQAYFGRYKSSSMTILSLSIAMVALFTPPFADIYRHTLLYFYFENHETSIFQTNGNDFIFYTLNNIFAKNKIPFEYISFLFVFICYQISFYLFRTVLLVPNATKWSRSMAFCVFLCFLLMVPFIAIINGLRMATAAYIALYAWYNIYSRHNIKGIVFYVVALCMHFGAWLFLPIMLCSLFYNRMKINRAWFFVVSIIFIAAGGFLLQVLPVSFIEAISLDMAVDGYMVNSDERFGDTMSFNGFVAMFLERFPLVAVIFLIIRNKLRVDANVASLIYIVIWLSLIYYPFTVLFQRYAFFAVPLLIFLCISSEKGCANCFYSTNVKVLLLSCIVMTVSYMYGYRAAFTNTQFYKMFQPSVITIPSTNTHDNFRNALIPK